MYFYMHEYIFTGGGLSERQRAVCDKFTYIPQYAEVCIYIYIYIYIYIHMYAHFYICIIALAYIYDIRYLRYM
jgi:hypothetical protein